MDEGTLAPSAEDMAVVREEEALLARVQRALGSATRAKADVRAVDELRELRDEAMQASADDLPALLHELEIRQQLARREPEPEPPSPASPYFAHLRVDEGGGSKDYLLGHRTFLEPRAGVRVVDWRTAPIARVFRECREGDPYEEQIGGRVAEGVVAARRIVVIDRGVLVQIVTDAHVLSREPSGEWSIRDRQVLARGGAGTAARPGVLGVGVGAPGRAAAIDITALLDEAQHRAIEIEPERPLLVLGSAGSGKTTVALHRLARIAAVDPARYPLGSARVIVPEVGLARLSRRLLEPIGGGAASVETLDQFAMRLAKRVFGPLPPIHHDAPGLVTRLKRHPALFRALGSRAKKVGTLGKLRKRLATLFTDRAFLAEVVASAGDLPKSAIEETVRHTRLQLADGVDKLLALVTIPELKEAVDGRDLADGTPDELAGSIDVEDLPILLFLRSLDAPLGAPEIAHLVIDEAEDVSHFELHVAGELLRDRAHGRASVTLAGDELQQTASGFAGWDAALATLGVRDASTCRLTVSYRCPRPIVELAHAIFGEARETRAARDGAPVERFSFPDQAQADVFAVDAARDLAFREPRASIALLTRDEDAARRLHALIPSSVPNARLSLDGELPFEPGIDVLDVDGSKGLEFDYVIVADASAAAYPRDDESRRRLHVAVTRAAHQLWMVSGGEPSPLLPAG